MRRYGNRSAFDSSHLFLLDGGRRCASVPFSDGRFQSPTSQIDPFLLDRWLRNSVRYRQYYRFSRLCLRGGSLVGLRRR